MTTAEYIAAYNLPENEETIDTTHFIAIEYLGTNWNNYQKWPEWPEWLPAAVCVWADVWAVLKQHGYMRFTPVSEWAVENSRYWANPAGEVVRTWVESNGRSVVGVGTFERSCYVNRGGYWRRPPQIKKHVEKHSSL